MNEQLKNGDDVEEREREEERKKKCEKGRERKRQRENTARERAHQHEKHVNLIDTANACLAKSFVTKKIRNRYLQDNRLTPYHCAAEPLFALRYEVAHVRPCNFFLFLSIS